MATRWSTAEDQLLRQLYADQLPVEQIAGRLARSADAVVARRQALACPPRSPPNGSGAQLNKLAPGAARLYPHRLERART